MMKKLIATALAAAMIFGLVSVAFAAADLPDIDGYEWEKEVRRLASLGIIDGYGDGTFKPENTVTRAEFAKMIVCMLGLEGAANLLKGEAGPFADVPGTHWASGFINVAEMKGIVSGYPDGTFKPEGSITYAEALKMVLAAMGYLEEGFLVVRWPVTWVIKAAEIELDEGVEILANLPISRGNVAKIFDNSLTMPHVKVGEHGFEDLEKTVDGVKVPVAFMDKLGVSSIVGQLIDSPELWDNETGKAKVQPKEGKAKTFAVEGYEGLLGHKVRVWYKGSNVLGVEDLSTEKVLTKTEYGKVKGYADDALYVLNYDVKEAKPSVGSSCEIAVVYDGSTPIAVKAVDYTVGTIADIYGYRTAIYLEEQGRLNLGGFDVEYKGAVKEFSDLEKGDVVHYIHDADNERAVIFVVRDIYEGKLLEVTYDGKLKVGDKTFAAATDQVVDDAKLNLGKTVTLYLNKDGKVSKVQGPEAVAGAFYGIVLATSRRYVDGGTKYFAKFLTLNGEVEYETAAELKVGDVVKVDAVGADGIAVITASVFVNLEDKKVEPDGSTTFYAVASVDAKTRTISTKSYDEDTLWIEKTSAGYVERPRAYNDDVVLLVLDGTDVKVGIVGTHYEVTFTVKDKDNAPVNGATITITSGTETIKSLTTNASGKATIVLKPGTYNYKVTGVAGHKDASGSIKVTNSEVSKTVSMEASS